MVVREVDEILRLEDGGELAGDQRRVLGTDSEGDEGADVSEDSIPHGRLELAEILVSEDESDPVLPELGEHCGEGECGEGMELVEVEPERPPGRLRQLGTLKSVLRDSRDEERPEESSDQIFLKASTRPAATRACRSLGTSAKGLKTISSAPGMPR